MITALIFDFDGTLFDTSAANLKSYSSAFKDAGISFDKNLYLKCFGLRYDEMIKIVAPNIDDASKQKIKTLKAEYYSKNISLVKPNTALIDLVIDAAKSYKTALVTTASPHNVSDILDLYFGQDLPFETVITGADVSKGKPDPEGYILAMDRLGVKPHECIIFEDSEVGVKAAQRAGAGVVRVSI